MTAHAKRNKPRRPDDGPRTAAVASAHKTSPLQRLIRQRLRERGWSYGEVARRGGLPRSTVYTLATTPNLARPPRPATIDALAEGLNVPVSAVRASAIESTGLYYYEQVPAGQQDQGDRERELLVAGIDELTPEDRRRVVALVESLRAGSRRSRRTASVPRGRQRLEAKAQRTRRRALPLILRTGTLRRYADMGTERRLVMLLTPSHT
jgi:transcriptional regulator with XRE-family HTH domain